MKFSIISAFLICSFSLKAQYNNIYKESSWKERDTWQHPDWILDAMRVKEGSIVADIGCNQGYLTVKLADKIGDSGKVYAVDVDTYLLEKLRDNLNDRKLSDRVEVIKGDYDNPNLPDNLLDAVVIIDSYHEMKDYKSMLDHIFHSLKPKGRFILIEPIAPEREDWTRDKQTAKHEISIRYARSELKDAGFTIIKEENPFIDRTEAKGDKEWMIVAIRPQ